MATPDATTAIAQALASLRAPGTPGVSMDPFSGFSQPASSGLYLPPGGTGSSVGMAGASAVPQSALPRVGTIPSGQMVLPWGQAGASAPPPPPPSFSAPRVNLPGTLAGAGPRVAQAGAAFIPAGGLRAGFQGGVGVGQAGVPRGVNPATSLANLPGAGAGGVGAVTAPEAATATGRFAQAFPRLGANAAANGLVTKSGSVALGPILGRVAGYGGLGMFAADMVQKNMAESTTQDAVQGGLDGGGLAMAVAPLISTGPVGWVVAGGVLGGAALSALLGGDKGSGFNAKTQRKSLTAALSNAGLDQAGRESVLTAYDLTLSQEGLSDAQKKEVYNGAIQMAIQERYTQVDRDAQLLAQQGQVDLINQYFAPTADQLQADSQAIYQLQQDSIARMSGPQQAYAQQAALTALGGANKQAAAIRTSAQMYPSQFAIQQLAQQPQQDSGDLETLLAQMQPQQPQG